MMLSSLRKRRMVKSLGASKSYLIFCSKNAIFPTESHQMIFRFSIGGASGSGKTSLIERYLHDKFEETMTATVGCATNIKKLSINEDDVKIQINDLAGQESFDTITSIYFRNAIAVILVFSLNFEDSFSAIDRWYRKATNIIPPNSAVFILVGNKDDLKPYTVSEDRAREYAESKGMHYFSASAKTGNRVNDFFDETIYDVYNKVKNGELKIETEGTKSLENYKAKKKSWC